MAPSTIPARTRSARRGRTLQVMIAFLCMIALAGGVWFWLQSKQRPRTMLPTVDKNADQADKKKSQEDKANQATGNQKKKTRTEDPSLAPFPENPGYVGIDACTACHKDRVAEFKQTRHFHACLPPDPKEMPARFTREGSKFKPPVGNVNFTMRRTDDGFTMTTEQFTPEGNRRFESTIDFVYGLGLRSDHGYFGFDGEALYELPMSWLFPTEEWGATSFDPYGTGNLGRPTTFRCMECHNTWFAHRPGSLNLYDRHSFVLGVQCEVCHGPGKEHVAHHEQHPGEKIAQKVIQPTKFSRQQVLDLCAYCHSNAIKQHGPALQYRPGEPLEKYYTSLTLREPEHNHVANQHDYMMQSKCFQNSEMTCVTCHSPHAKRAPDHAKQDARRGQSTQHGAETCAACHKPEVCRDQPNLPEAVRGDCIGCHMPQRNKMGVSFDTTTDRYVPPVKRYEHRIGVYPEARMSVLRKWHADQKDDDKAAELAKSLEKHWLDEAKARLDHHRLVGAVDAYREALSYVPAKETRESLDVILKQLAEADELKRTAKRQFDSGDRATAIKTFKKSLEITPNDSFVIGSLGTAYAVSGDKPEALRLWNEVAKADPNDAYGLGMLAWNAFLEGRPEEAIDLFAQADKITPGQIKTHFNMALAFGRLNRFDEAREQLEIALKLDPRHVETALAMGELHLRQDAPEKATPYLENAALWTRNQRLDVLMSLFQAYNDQGQRTEAGDIEQRIYTLVEQAPPKVIAEVRGRIDQIRQGKSRKGR